MSLSHCRFSNNLHILLVNNNGGVEFKLGGLQNKTVVGDYIAADNHFKSAKGWAETNGFRYISAHSKKEFLELQSEFLSVGDKPVLFEVFTSEEDERLANQTMFGNNEILTAKSLARKTAAKVIKNVVGEQGTILIKKILK